MMCLAFVMSGFGLALQNAHCNGFVASSREHVSTKIGFLHASYGTYPRRHLQVVHNHNMSRLMENVRRSRGSCRAIGVDTVRGTEALVVSLHHLGSFGNSEHHYLMGHIPRQKTRRSAPLRLFPLENVH